MLVLSVWGAIVDNRYKAKGGKRPPKNERTYILTGAGLVVALLLVLGYLGVTAEALGALTGDFAVLIFAGYEAMRFWIRRANALPAFKK